MDEPPALALSFSGDRLPLRFEPCAWVRLEPATALFIDDSAANVATATALGFHAIQFTDAAALRLELVRLGLIPRGRNV